MKPGFFANEDLGLLSPLHRLCFAGLWGCADRSGRIEDRPRRLKAQIFPYESDQLDLDCLLWDLAERGFIVRYVVDGTAYLWIRSWDRHQFPRTDERPSAIPPFVSGTERLRGEAHAQVSCGVSQQLNSDEPVSVQTSVQQVGDGILEIGTGELEAGSGRAVRPGTPDAPRSAPQSRPGVAEQFRELWNSTVTRPIPRVRELTDGRVRKIRDRLSHRPSLDEWRQVFVRIESSSFLRGQSSTRRGAKPWVIDFDWVIDNDTRAVQILEGKFDDRTEASAVASTTTDNLAARDRLLARFRKDG